MSRLSPRPRGLELPCVWRARMWRTITRSIAKGKIKCREKKRERVGSLTEKPPQIQDTKSSPTKGTVVMRLVITVAPQKDICPQGKTYPRNAVPIKPRRRTHPDNHTAVDRNELK